MLESGTEYYYITTVANAAAVINDVEENTVTIEGKLAMGTVSFIGTEDEQAIVNIASNAEVTSGNVTLDNARLNVISGAQFTATVTDGNGSVDVKIVSQEETSATAAPSFSENTKDGFVVGDNASGAEMTFNGTVIVTDLTVSKMTVEGTVTIDGTSTSVTETLQINGTVTVQNGVLTATNAKTFVNGELTAIEATADSKDVGNAELGDTYVGIGLGDDEKTLVDGNAGTIVGNVVATIAYVSSDSTVPEDMISGDNVKSTQFYVDDALWMTAYTADASANKAKVPNAPVTDALFMGWNLSLIHI